MGKLVIVESPSKAKTIKKYLGRDYEVIASQGHIVDLPANKLAVDVDNDFKPEYKTMPDKAKLIKDIKEQAKDKEIVYLATDPDREGEAIAWHLKNLLKIKDNRFNNLQPIPYSFGSGTKDVGTSVFAMGYPKLSYLGEELKVTDGIISSKTGYQGDITTYQISAPIQPGNSGGPLFDKMRKGGGGVHHECGPCGGVQPAVFRSEGSLP